MSTWKPQHCLDLELVFWNSLPPVVVPRFLVVNKFEAHLIARRHGVH